LRSVGQVLFGIVIVYVNYNLIAYCYILSLDDLKYRTRNIVPSYHFNGIVVTILFFYHVLIQGFHYMTLSESVVYAEVV